MKPEKMSRKAPVQLNHSKEHILMSDMKQQSLSKRKMKAAHEED